MDWQDIVGGALAAGATGDPFAWSRNKLEQAFKQFQMQKMTNDLEMQREMHGMEKQKLDILLKQKQREEELENHPVSGILAALGHKVPEGAENVTVGQAKYAAPIAQIFQKEQDEFAPIPGTTALFGKKSGKVKETGLEGKPEKPVNVPAWADAMGLAKMGAKYHTAKGQQEFADYLATPQGQQEELDGTGRPLVRDHRMTAGYDVVFCHRWLDAHPLVRTLPPPGIDRVRTSR